jgi:5'-deoxynucleotidase YfbR-like HD superfamily hydrolase
MDKNLTRQIIHHRKMLNVQRMSGSPKIRSYNLAEHSYFVATMFEEFAKEEGIKYSTDAIYVVLRHDIMEVLTSDLPYPVKNFNDTVKQAWDLIEEELYQGNKDRFITMLTDEEIKRRLTEEEFRLMKSCDILDLYLFCLEERQLGNHSLPILRIIDNCVQILEYYRIESVLSILEKLRISIVGSVEH